VSSSHSRKWERETRFSFSWLLCIWMFMEQHSPGDIQLRTCPFSVAGRISAPYRAPGFCHLSTLQRRWWDSRAPGATVSSSRLGLADHLARRKVHRGPSTSLGHFLEWGGDLPPWPVMREKGEHPMQSWLNGVVHGVKSFSLCQNDGQILELAKVPIKVVCSYLQHYNKCLIWFLW